MGAVAAVAGKDLRQRWRDRSAVLAGVVTPLVLAFLISLAFGRGAVTFRATFAVVDLDGGAAARSFVDGVLHSEQLRDSVTTRDVATVGEAERLARNGDVAAAFIVPVGFTASLAAASPASLTVVRSAREPIGADVAEAVARSYLARLAAVRVATAAAGAALGSTDPASYARLAADASAGDAAVVLDERPASVADTSAGSYFAPAMAVFFLWFVAALGARSMLAERRDGTMARLLAAPVPASRVLAGKLVATFVLCVSTVTVMAVASSILLRARWGPPLAVAAVLLSLCLALTAVSAVVLSVARTQQQVALVMSVLTFGAALLGGNFVQLTYAPSWLQRASLLTPNGWALRAFGDLGAGEGAGVAVRPVLALLAIAAVAGAVAAARSRQVLRP